MKHTTNVSERVTRTFYIFKEGIPPLWEDSYNVTGGCWTMYIYTQQSTAQIWNMLVCQTKVVTSIQKNLIQIKDQCFS